MHRVGEAVNTEMARGAMSAQIAPFQPSSARDRRTAFATSQRLAMKGRWTLADSHGIGQAACFRRAQHEAAENLRNGLLRVECVVEPPYVGAVDAAG